MWPGTSCSRSRRCRLDSFEVAARREPCVPDAVKRHTGGGDTVRVFCGGAGSIDASHGASTRRTRLVWRQRWATSRKVRPRWISSRAWFRSLLEPGGRPLGSPARSAHRDPRPRVVVRSGRGVRLRASRTRAGTLTHGDVRRHHPTSDRWKASCLFNVFIHCVGSSESNWGWASAGDTSVAAEERLAHA